MPLTNFIILTANRYLYKLDNVRGGRAGEGRKGERESGGGERMSGNVLDRLLFAKGATGLCEIIFALLDQI